MNTDYYKTAESVQEYIKMAKDVNGARLIEKLKKRLPNNSDLLEIGSGPGSDWKILSESYKVTGSDNSIEFLKHLRCENPQASFLELDAVSLLTDKKFDGIYSNKVLHHLTTQDLDQSIERQYNILNNNGIICHSFWKGVGSETYKGLLVNYHDEVGLQKLFGKYFEVITIDIYKEFEDEDSLLLIAKRKD